MLQQRGNQILKKSIIYSHKHHFSNNIKRCIMLLFSYFNEIVLWITLLSRPRRERGHGTDPETPDTGLQAR